MIFGNALWIFLAWLLTACALGGRYLAHDQNIGPVVAVLLALLITAQTIAVDREERNR